jgi:Fe2+ transport protein
MRLTANTWRRRVGPGLTGIACLALAACGSSAGLSSTGSRTVTNPAATSMAGMQMEAGAGKSMSAGGIKAIPTQTLGTATWQGMKIQARAMTAVPFVIYDGTHERLVRPPKRVSFHLMVDLNDARTGVAIPYAGVWATITRQARTVYDERQWPMISEYMGPHDGNNVLLPGPGTYRLSLLVSPPVSARHVEYRDVWLKPHRVTMSFAWKPS